MTLSKRVYRYRFLLYCLSFMSLNASFAQDSIDVPLDTLALEQPAQVDTVAVTAEKLAHVKQQFGRYDTRFLDNINIPLLSKELLLLSEKNVEASRLIDSLESEQLADTVVSLQESAEERKSRIIGFRNTATTYKSSLDRVVAELRQLGADSLFHPELAGRSAVVNYNELNELHLQIRQKEIKTSQKRDSLQALMDESSHVLEKTELLLASLANVQGEASFARGRRDAKSLWSASASFDRTHLKGGFNATYRETAGVTQYLKDTEWTGRIFLILLSVGFFYWLFNSGRKTHQLTGNSAHYAFTSDILKSLVFLFSLLPIFSIFTPSILVQITQLLVVILLIADLRKPSDNHKRRWFSYLSAFYLLVIITNTVVNADLISRLITLSLNVVALFICYRMLKGPTTRFEDFRVNKYLFSAFVVMHLLAMAFNVFGYIQYARYWSIAGAVGIIQSISLVGFFNIVVGAFERQFEYTSTKASISGSGSRFDRLKALRSIRSFLTVLCVALGFVVLLINLHRVHEFFTWLLAVLDQPRSIGNISFTFGNLVVGIVIITIANWLQKHLPVLLGDKGQQGYGDEEERGTVLSLMPIFRLLIIVAGLLMGFSALGIGMNNLTVILSALSVGIGFGLQNIINNFISGIILIFEKPFRRGDFIELADKKGRVQAIGIRSSTLLTQEGSEVVIPNGDLLSGRLVNWTLSKSYSRVSVGITIPKDSDMQVVKRVLRDVSNKIDYIMDESEIEMLYAGVAADTITLTLNTWIINIYNADIFRSQLLKHLSEEFQRRDISMVSA